METQTVIQKPQSVSTAVNLLWMSLAIHLVSTLMKYFNVGGVLASHWLPNSIVVFGIAISAFLIFTISAGKNWARVVYLVVFVTDVIPLSFILADFSQSLLINILFMTKIGLQAYAMFMLFTQPARSWFLRKWQGNSDMKNKEK